MPDGPLRSPSAAVVIPARLGSRRFPRKVLARETGKFLVQHVWDAVVGCARLSRVIVATDSREVLEAVRSFGAEALLTSPDHVSGTDRVAEVARGLEEDIIINVQADEPGISHAEIASLVELFDAESAPAALTAREERTRWDMTTLAVRRSDHEGFGDPNVVKVVAAGDGRALYFSRAPVPYARLSAAPGTPSWHWWQHVGVYGYRRSFLLALGEVEPTELEQRERLEQLRVLENGFLIRVGEASRAHPGIDTPEEYRRFVKEMEHLRDRSGPRAEIPAGAASAGEVRPRKNRV